MDDNTLTIESAVLGDIPGIVEFVVEWLQRQGLDKYVFALETAVDEARADFSRSPAPLVAPISLLPSGIVATSLTPTLSLCRKRSASLRTEKWAAWEYT
jgi:hypothetical protein